ncbi:MAG: Hpt domain-containing protein [Candidatus Melainabacteria bacterium]|nr:Hpt domain-containing protein [Candidatus Melainabacteria bacterium]
MQENAPQAGVNDIVGIKNLEAEFDVELAKELAQAYLDDTDSIIEKMQAALDADDKEALRSSAHMLKGCSRALQAWKCEQASSLLESDARDGNMEFARNNFPDVVEAFTQTKAILQQYLLS